MLSSFPSASGELFIAALVSGTNQNDLLRGIGLSLLEAENFLEVYNSEFIPDETNVFIEEWETTLGIPDDCFPGSSEDDTDTRRSHILVKLYHLSFRNFSCDISENDHIEPYLLFN